MNRAGVETLGVCSSTPGISCQILQIPSANMLTDIFALLPLYMSNQSSLSEGIYFIRNWGKLRLVNRK